jgi:hypothetical protein
MVYDNSVVAVALAGQWSATKATNDTADSRPRDLPLIRWHAPSRAIQFLHAILIA